MYSKYEGYQLLQEIIKNKKEIYLEYHYGKVFGRLINAKIYEVSRNRYTAYVTNDKRDIASVGFNFEDICFINDTQIHLGEYPND